MNFAENLKNTLNNDFNNSVTENGAVGFRTTGKKLLDLNFSVSSLRNKSDEEIVNDFIKAYYENPMLAVKWLFYAGDVRGGMGERRLFRVCFKYLAEAHKETACALLDLVPEYTRWDNVLCLLGTDAENDVIKLISAKLAEDTENMRENKPVSLLAKWLPSVNTSSKETKTKARIITEKLGMTEKQYRKTLSTLRAYLKVVETYMSAGEWSKIDYSAVPSRANLIYGRAFLKNDETRRLEYLGKLKLGETKINAGVLFPHDIVNKYMILSGSWHCALNKKTDATLEELWKALPDYVKGDGNTICVADGSGSMLSSVGKTTVTALDVANSLAIYFAERSSGAFKDKYITFSANPQLVDLSKGKSLRQKLEIALTHYEVANTNIEKVFDLILQTALNSHASQKDMPKNILILSDMEFDGCISCGGNSYSPVIFNKPSQKLFDLISKKYKTHGYKLPRVIFWNICSRTGTIPLRENNLGVALVSGFNPSVVNMVLSGNLDPFECLKEQLNSERYETIEERITGLV